MKIIDLKTKTIKENGKFLIKNGIPQNGYTLDKTKITWEELEKAYEEYKHSVPNGIKYHHKYFKALEEEELSTEDLIKGANRGKAKEKLECMLLTGILNGSLTWPDEKKWFWQSAKDKDFVLLKTWFA